MWCFFLILNLGILGGGHWAKCFCLTPEPMFGIQAMKRLAKLPVIGDLMDFDTVYNSEKVDV
jgi:hypothetical protein